MRKWLVVSFVFALGVGTAAVVIQATSDEVALGSQNSGPKYTIKEVMQTIKKLKLVPKVSKGEANEKERMKLMDLVLSLRENEPPKGKKADWLKRCNDLLAATCKVVLQYDGAEAELKKAANCGGCHKGHKGK